MYSKIEVWTVTGTPTIIMFRVRVTSELSAQLTSGLVKDETKVRENQARSEEIEVFCFKAQKLK